jgi:hypothetical protein
VILIWQEPQFPNYWHVAGIFLSPESGRIDKTKKPVSESAVWLTFEQMAGSHLPTLEMVTTSIRFPAELLSDVIGSAP